MPTTLVMRVWNRSRPGTRSPFKYALSCGSPDAAAIGVYLKVRARVYGKGFVQGLWARALGEGLGRGLGARGRGSAPLVAAVDEKVALLEAGLTEAMIKDWSVDPQVTISFKFLR